MSADPISDIDAVIREINAAPGVRPNIVVARCSREVFRLIGSRKSRKRRQGFRLWRREFFGRFNLQSAICNLP